MKALRCLFAVALLIVAAPAMAADDDPASVLPANALAVLRLEKAGAQTLLSTFALPPLAKMFAPDMVSPFAYVNALLRLPAGTAEKIAPHVTGAAFTALIDPKNPRRDPDAVFIISFDDARWPRELLAKLPEGQLPEGHILAIGMHLLICEDAEVAAPLIQGDFLALDASPHYQSARKQAAGSLLWATCSVPPLLKTIRAAMRKHEREEMDAFSNFLGLDHLTYALLTVKGAGTSASVELTVGLDGKPNKTFLALLPTGKIVGAAPAPADAAAKLALNWGDAPRFFGGIHDQIRATMLAIDPDEVEEFDEGIAQVEAAIGVPLDAVFGQLGAGVSAFLLPPDKHGMIGREDWAAVLPLKKSAAFKASLHNAFMAVFRGNVPPAQDVGGLSVRQVVPDAPVFYTVTPDALVVSGSPANVKRAVELKKVPTDGLAMLHLNAGRLMANYPQPVPDTLMLNVALTRTAKQLKLAARLDGLPEGKTLKQMLLPVNSILAGMLLPRFTKARARRQRALDMANLRQIGTSIEKYRQDNNGQYPPTLKTLVDKKYAKDMGMFITPGDANPPVVNGLKCSYVYIGTPLPAKIPASTIICYTRPGVFARQRNVLHADLAARSTWHGGRGPMRNPRGGNDFAVITKLLGDALTEARKKELAKFYGVRLRRDTPPIRGERDFPLPSDR